MGEFYLDEYIKKRQDSENLPTYDFHSLCRNMREAFLKEWESRGDMIHVLELQKKAIIGYRNEVAYFQDRIRQALEEMKAEKTEYPSWYESLEEGIYHENWGLAGLAQWFGPDYADSSSAKVIGERIYFMKNGVMKQVPQTIRSDRREQMIRAFLLLTPGERLNKDFHELYLLDGTRVTVFTGKMVKNGQDVIIFRRYVVPSYTFAEQVARGTIPVEGETLFPMMVGLGYNVVMTGAVRTAKTTFLTTWQSYEDPALEGVLIETDPEIPLHKLMPEAPIVQVLADGEKLSSVSKNLLRSDADYIVMGEARDGTALELAFRMAAKGTRRMKMTFHCREPMNFPMDAAWEVVKTTGGDLEMTARKAAASFDYLFHFVQLKEKNKKRLRGIFEMTVSGMGEINISPLCLFDFETETWSWQYRMAEDKRLAGEEENRELFFRFDKELKRLGEGKESAPGKKPLKTQREGGEVP